MEALQTERLVSTDGGDTAVALSPFSAHRQRKTDTSKEKKTRFATHPNHLGATR